MEEELSREQVVKKYSGSPVGAVTMALAYTSQAVGSVRMLLWSAVDWMETAMPISPRVAWADSASRGSSWRLG